MQRLGMRYEYTYEELWQPKNKRVFFRMYQLNLDRQKKNVSTGAIGTRQPFILWRRSFHISCGPFVHDPNVKKGAFHAPFLLSVNAS